MAKALFVRVLSCSTAGHSRALGSGHAVRALLVMRHITNLYLIVSRHFIDTKPWIFPVFPTQTRYLPAF